MDIKTKATLYDIQMACQLVRKFIAAQTFDDYHANIMLKPAVERQFITIGEALNKAIQRSPSLEWQITDSRKIVDFRNILTHGYASITDEVVWDIVTSNLPILMQDVSNLLNQVGLNPDGESHS